MLGWSRLCVDVRFFRNVQGLVVSVFCDQTKCEPSTERTATHPPKPYLTTLSRVIHFLCHTNTQGGRRGGRVGRRQCGRGCFQIGHSSSSKSSRDSGTRQRRRALGNHRQRQGQRWRQRGLDAVAALRMSTGSPVQGHQPSQRRRCGGAPRVHADGCGCVFGARWGVVREGMRVSRSWPDGGSGGRTGAVAIDKRDGSESSPRCMITVDKQGAVAGFSEVPRLLCN